jgi:hypothetical protein
MVFFDATLALEARPGADRAHNRPTYAHPITCSEPFISRNAVPANLIYLKVYVPSSLDNSRVNGTMSFWWQGSGFRYLYVTHLCAYVCSANEKRGKLTNAGAMVYDLVGSVVDGLRRLSYNVALENPAFNNMMRVLARGLHVSALATLQTPIIGVLYLLVLRTICHRVSSTVQYRAPPSRPVTVHSALCLSAGRFQPSKYKKLCSSYITALHGWR